MSLWTFKSFVARRKLLPEKLHWKMTTVLESDGTDEWTLRTLRGNLILGVLNWAKKCHALQAALEIERDESWCWGAESREASSQSIRDDCCSCTRMSVGEWISRDWKIRRISWLWCAKENVEKAGENMFSWSILLPTTVVEGFEFQESSGTFGDKCSFCDQIYMQIKFIKFCRNFKYFCSISCTFCWLSK